MNDMCARAADAGKRAAALRALDFVQSGMRLGLGSGSTVAFFVEALGEKVRAGLDVVGVPTSEATRRQAEALGIRLAELDEIPELDLTVDGADEIDPSLRLIKGGGGALLREKLVALASRRVVVIADASKKVSTLGRFPLPVEIVPFGIETTVRRIARVADAHGLPRAAALRRAADGRLFMTDGGHHILDLSLRAIPDPEALGRDLKAVVGVVEHGLFCGIATEAVIAEGDLLEHLS